MILENFQHEYDYGASPSAPLRSLNPTLSSNQFSSSASLPRSPWLLPHSRCSPGNSFRTPNAHNVHANALPLPPSATFSSFYVLCTTIEF